MKLVFTFIAFVYHLHKSTLVCVCHCSKLSLTQIPICLESPSLSPLFTVFLSFWRSKTVRFVICFSACSKSFCLWKKTSCWSWCPLVCYQ